jgi:general secretion pathway protein D
MTTRRDSRTFFRVAAACFLAITLLLGACAPGSDLVRSGKKLIDQGQSEAGLAQIDKALALEPENTEYRVLAVRQREALTRKYIKDADSARDAQQLDDAEASYQRALALDPANNRARTGIDAVDLLRRQQQRVEQAELALAQGRRDDAGQLLRHVLGENPGNTRAQILKRQLDDQLAAAKPLPDPETPALKAKLRKPVTLEFRDANLKAVFEALSRSTGINFVFDRDVKPDIKVTLSIANLSVEDVIGVLTITNQLERKTLNDNTVLVYPNTPEKQKDYLELSVKTFYLANAEAKNISAMLKTVLKTKDLHADEKLNTITMRDTANAIHLAEKLIAAQDLAEPEVVLDVEVLEVKRSRLMELGVDPPGKFTVLNIVQNPDTVVSTATGATTVVNNTLTSTQLTLEKLRNTNSSNIGVDNPSINIRAQNGDTNILANPRIRVKNREKAKIMIGDRVPVITSTQTANVGTSESVSYLDVGLKLDVEPNVFLNNEVGVKVALEVSNIVKEVRSRSGTLTYQIGSRNALTELRLKDGETQALAGLISDEDRKGAVGLPWLIDLPVIGRLFSSETSDRNKTEIVLLITPRIVRNLDPSAASRSEMAGGTEKSVGAPRLSLQGGGKMAGSLPRVGSSMDPNDPASAPAEQAVSEENPADDPRQGIPRRRAQIDSDE